MQSKNDTLIVVLLVLAGVGYAWHTGELQLPTEQGQEQFVAPTGTFSKSDLCRALANQVEANRVEDTDRLLTIAENVGKEGGVDIKAEMQSRCGFEAGKPKVLIADPEFGKRVAGALRQMGGN